ncbi:MAG: hypothetical protein WBG62_04640 [Cyclobacteriaceae bacterium]
MEKQDIQLNFEIVTEGSNSELIKKLKTILISDPDIIVAHLSKFQRQEIAPLMKRHKIPLLALDSGEFLPYPSENEYVIPHSAGLWKEIFALGLYSATLQGNPMLSFSFYESGYQFLTSFALALNYESKEEYYLLVDSGGHTGAPFNLQRLRKEVMELKPSFVFAGSTGSELDHIIQGYSSEASPLALLSTSVPEDTGSTILSVIRAIPEVKTIDALDYSINYYREKQHYYWLAASCSTAIMTALGEDSNFISSLRNIMAELNPESIPGKKINFEADLIQEQSDCSGTAGVLASVKKVIPTDDLHRLSEEYISGFSEPYLCH